MLNKLVELWNRLLCWFRGETHIPKEPADPDDYKYAGPEGRIELTEQEKERLRKPYSDEEIERMKLVVGDDNE